MDDLATFERAITLTFEVLQQSPSKASSSSMGQMVSEATAYCARVESSPMGWMLTLELLRHTTRSEVKFFCLQALQKLLNNEAGRYTQLSEQHTIQLRQLFMRWISETSLGPCTEEKYIRAKVGVVLALLAKQQYPQTWPTCFDDMLDLLMQTSSPTTPTAAERLVLMLAALDEEVVCHGGPEAMVIKDAMRVQVVYRLMPALGEICRAYQDVNFDLVRKCWSVIGLYAVWVDISLTTEESFLRVWFAHCMDDRFKVNALPALSKLVQKGMDPDNKLKLISQLGLADCCMDMCCPGNTTFAPSANSVWTQFKQQHHAPPSPQSSVTSGSIIITENEDFELEAAKFLSSLGTELLFCRKATTDPGGLVLRPLMERVLFCLFSFMSVRVDKYDLQDELLEFANKIVISNQPSGGWEDGMVDVFGPEIMRSMFFAILQSVGLPQDHDMNVLLLSSSTEDDVEGEDFREHRSNVKRLFLNLVRCSGPKQVLPLLHHIIHTFFTTAHNIESILYLVYAFGEAAPELSSHLKKNSSPVTDPEQLELVTNFDLLLVSIFQSPAFQTGGGSAVVAVMYNELAARYVLNLRAHPCLPGIIQRMCGTGGVHHTNYTVRSKASVLLLRMIRTLDQFCAPLCVSIFASLQDVLTNGLQFEICCRESRRQQRTTNGGEVLLSVADVLQIFEAAGFMLGNPQLWSEEQTRKAYLTHIVQGTLENSLQLACKSLNGNNKASPAGGGRQRSNEDLMQWGACQLEALASVCKGFALQDDDAIIALWRNVLRTALIATVQFLQASSSSDDEYLLNSLRRLCHALIRTLGVEILVFFPDICQCLLETPNADVCRALPLLNQMMCTFRTKMYDSLAQSLLPILRATNSRISPIANLPQPTTHDVEEFIAMEKELFTFLFSIASNELSPVFYHELNISHLEGVLILLADGLGSIADAAVQKVCAQTLLCLCKEWLSPTQSPAVQQIQQAFFQFTLDRITPASFQATVQPHFDPKDAACSQLLLQICQLHLTLCDLLGARWLDFLRNQYLPSTCGMELAQEYCNALQTCKNSPKELRVKFQKLFLGRAS